MLRGLLALALVATQVVHGFLNPSTASLLKTKSVTPSLASLSEASGRPRRGGAVALRGVAAADIPGDANLRVMRRRTVTIERLHKALPIKIDGKWYDVSDYAGTHPGGQWLFDYARGTPPFHSKTHAIQDARCTQWAEM